MSFNNLRYILRLYYEHNNNILLKFQIVKPKIANFIKHNIYCNTNTGCNSLPNSLDVILDYK